MGWFENKWIISCRILFLLDLNLIKIIWVFILGFFVIYIL